MGAMRPTKGEPPRIGLALAGGGPEGAVYQIGALQALDEALQGIDLADLHVYVGVSAGSFIAACLANKMTAAQLCRSTFEEDPAKLPFAPRTFFTPAVKEMLRRALMTPGLAIEAVADYVSSPADRSLFEALTRLTRALPVGLFDNEPIRAYLNKIFDLRNRTDDFRKLEAKLVVVAADLDSGQAVRFGEPGMDHIPISQAVQASTALPGLYPPVEIEGRHYVDGVLLKTLHASVALDSEADLVLCLNPIVPVDTSASVEAGVMRRGKLLHRGLPTVLSQTFRTLVHSRLSAGLASYERRYPHADIVLFEPDRDDYRMFFTNVFTFSDRKAVCQHAYHSTRKQLLQRRAELEPIFALHGIRMRIDVLGEQRELGPVSHMRARPRAQVTEDLNRTLSRLEALLGESS
jgi:predicted acylesterase/phospholipase RssA